VPDLRRLRARADAVEATPRPVRRYTLDPATAGWLAVPANALRLHLAMVEARRQGRTGATLRELLSAEQVAALAL